MSAGTPPPRPTRESRPGQSASGADPDVVVVGAGHNGLVCAAYLARAGLSVLVLEARETPGGCASTVDVLGGARVNICNCDHTMILTTSIREELDLASHGLRYLDVDPAQIGISWSGGPPVVGFRDTDRTLDALAYTHPGLVDGYRRYLAAAAPVAELVIELAGSPPGPGAVLRRLLERRGRGLARLLAWSRRSAVDVLEPFFGSSVLTTANYAMGPAVWGAAPNTPGTGLGALGPATRHLVGVGRPAGGSGALPDAQCRALTAAGGRLRCKAEVSRILVDGDTAVGVELADGEVVRAGAVVATTDPRRTIVDWLGPSAPASAAGLVRRWAARPVPAGYESKLDAVLAARPRYRAFDDATLATLGLDEPLTSTTVIAPSVGEMAAAHRLLGAGEVARRPIFVVNVPSVLDPSMRPPDGGEVFSLEVLWTPFDRRGGWATDDEPRRWLNAYAELVEPGFAESVLRWRAMTPPAYETDFGMPRGYAPSFAGGPLAALVGRDRELTRYETPVRGLFLSGAGTFPGAGVWGAAGRNAAHTVMTRLAATRSPS